MFQKLFTLVLAGFFFAQLTAQTAAPFVATADSLYLLEQWEPAAAAYRQALQTGKADPFWSNFRLAICYQNLEQDEAAIPYFRESVQNGQLPYPMYFLSVSLAKTNQPDSAFVWLEKAIMAGYPPPEQMEQQAGFENLKTDPRWQALLIKANKQAHPCRFEPKAREFDFWIGEWKVFNPAGVQVGESSVKLILDECVIFENWTNRVGSEGKSFNMYDAAAGIWRQTWVDQNGSWTEFRGGWNGSHMRITTDNVKQTDGSLKKRRMTFTPMEDGSVRQHGEMSDDDGKSWTTEYDLTYRKK